MVVKNFNELKLKYAIISLVEIYPLKNTLTRKFPGGSVGLRSGVATTVALVLSLAWELPNAVGVAKKILFQICKDILQNNLVQYFMHMKNQRIS